DADLAVDAGMTPRGGGYDRFMSTVSLWHRRFASSMWSKAQVDVNHHVQPRCGTAEVALRPFGS
ncbi:MAG: hypothetical protein V3S94_09205, partial [Gammaproteobacteria bacterium]